MDQILDIQLTFVGDEVVIQDNTDTSHVGNFKTDNYVSVDFFMNDNNEVVSAEWGEPKASVYIKLNDGKHKHRKLWIPKKEYLENNEKDSKVNEIYYHEGKIFKVINDDGVPEEVNISTASKLIDGGNATQTWYSTFQTIFCTSKLRKCVSLLQKQVIESCHKCNNIDSIKVKRDFLFNAMYLIDYLKETGNLDEAQRILDNLSCCGFICDDSIINTSNNCCD